VEDSPDNRTITLAYLKATPYTTDVAVNGAIACEKFGAGHYDLVLMDRQMPVMDGLTATRAIRQWELANHRSPTPIIALTAAALKGDQEKCLAAGCTAYLTKPIKQDVLLQAIKDHTSVHTHQPGAARERAAPIVVHANPLFADLIPGFLQNRRQDVIALRGALGRGDFVEIAGGGHRMRGAGGSYGFQTITDIGAALEDAGDKGDAEAAARWIDELSRYLDQVVVVP
jgi:CheY-like chemotaxis protein